MVVRSFRLRAGMVNAEFNIKRKNPLGLQPSVIVECQERNDHFSCCCLPQKLWEEIENGEKMLRGALLEKVQALQSSTDELI